MIFKVHCEEIEYPRATASKSAADTGELLELIRRILDEEQIKAGMRIIIKVESSIESKRGSTL